MYYNTLNESGQTLKTYRSKADSQDKIILAFFSRNKRKKFTPYDIKRAGILNRRTPIDSIRRSMNTLTSDDKLVKLDERKMETLGRSNSLWTFNKL